MNKINIVGVSMIGSENSVTWAFLPKTADRSEARYYGKRLGDILIGEDEFNIHYCYREGPFDFPYVETTISNEWSASSDELELEGQVYIPSYSKNVKNRKLELETVSGIITRLKRNIDTTINLPDTQKAIVEALKVEDNTELSAVLGKLVENLGDLEIRAKLQNIIPNYIKRIDVDLDEARLKVHLVDGTVKDHQIVV